MGHDKTTLLSRRLSAICELFDTAPKDYDYHYEQMRQCDAQTQDLLHAMELDDSLKYEGRARLATRLAACRQERRRHKDQLELLEPIVAFTETDRGKWAINQLKEVLGKVRKQERYHAERTYHPKCPVPVKGGK